MARNGNGPFEAAIIIFPGVRYETRDRPGDPKTADGAPRKRKGKIR